jgi:transposase InsO family protein
MCEVLEVSRSGFYRWLPEPIGKRQRRRDELRDKIRTVHEDSRRTYGSPRVHKELIEQGEKVCENTVARVMNISGIRSKTKRRFVVRTTQSEHAYPVARNLLDRRFAQPRPNRAWAGDITFIATDEGWLYLAVIIDLCSRMVVGWSMSDSITSDLTRDALEMAIARRGPGAGMLFHSDRGVQYACDAYQKILDQHDIVCSMSRRGNCYDNAAAESFIGTLKCELVYHEHYATRERARQSIFEYLEVFYNRKRRHSSLGYLSPEAFEAGLN